MKTFVRNFLLYFFVIIFLFCSVNVSAYAEEEKITFDESYVLDDLYDMTIEGEKFDFETYRNTSFKDTKILTFVEYAYNFDQTKQDEYSLYVYIYNPKKLNIDTDSSLNRVQLSFGDKSFSHYEHYQLDYLNKNLESGYEGLFYKFKVLFTPEQKKEILSELDYFSRVYKISSFELKIKDINEVEDIAFSKTYKYSGFAKGCGENKDAESSLVLYTDILTTLSFDSYHVNYRPDYSNAKNEFTKDSLNSVYFAIPKDYENLYGDLSGLYCKWLEAKLKPCLVSGNQDFINAVEPFIGKEVSGLDLHNGFSEIDFCYIGNYYLGWNGLTDEFRYYYNVAKGSGGYIGEDGASGYSVNPLYFLFNSGAYVDSADTYTVSSATLLEKVKELTKKFKGNLVLDKYSECLFDNVASEYTKLYVTSTTTNSLNNILIDKNLWQKFWGTSGSVEDFSSPFQDFNVLYQVKDTDFDGYDKEVSDKLLVSIADLPDLKNFYEENKDDCNVYLLRYLITDYVSQEASLCEDRNVLGVHSIKEIDTNAYFFHTSVVLDFDIIDVSFFDGTVETVIPVIHNPSDYFAPGTPPDKTTSDVNYLKLFLSLLLIVFIFILLNKFGILSFVFKAIIWLFKFIIKIIIWPFNLLFKNKKSSSKATKKRKR